MADDISDRLSAAVGFDWDEGNAPKVSVRHAVEPGECEQAFFQEPLVLSYDGAHSGREERWRALGRTVANRRLFLVFTMRGTRIRVLAARDMNRKERRYYEAIAAHIEEDPGV